MCALQLNFTKSAPAVSCTGSDFETSCIAQTWEREKQLNRGAGAFR